MWLSQTHVELGSAYAYSVGAALWMSQCCCGIMSVQNKLFVDIMIVVCKRFYVSFQANSSQYVYCAVSKVKTIQECVIRLQSL